MKKRRWFSLFLSFALLLPLFSLTKIMTALLVFEAIDEGRLSLNDSVTATESALNGLASDGSTANIVAGETMTVEQLLNCMLIVSANEACNILAEAVCGEGNISQFRQLGDARGVVLLVGVLFVEDLARFLLNEQGGAGVDVDLLKGGGRYAQQGDEQAEDQKKSKKAAFFHGNVPHTMLQS